MSYYGSSDDNIIFLGVILIISEAVILISYFFLATPILLVLNGLVMGLTGYVPQMATYGTPTLVIFNVMYAVAFIIPIVWFFLKIAQVESGYQRYRL